MSLPLCSIHPYYWAIGGSVDVFFTYDKYGLSFMGSWGYSREWVWKSRAKLHLFVSDVNQENEEAGTVSQGMERLPLDFLSAVENR